MVDIEIDIVHAQVFEALIQAGLDVLLTANALVNLLLGSGRELRGNHHAVPLRKVAQRPTYELLACAILIGEGRVVEVNAQVKAVADDVPRLRFVHRPAVLACGGVAEAHASHADAGYGQIRFAQFRVFHVFPS